MSEETSSMEMPPEQVGEIEKKKALGEEILSIINKAKEDQYKMSVLALEAAVRALKEGQPADGFKIEDEK